MKPSAFSNMPGISTTTPTQRQKKIFVFTSYMYTIKFCDENGAVTTTISGVLKVSIGNMF